jgi:predicted acyltransferase
MFTFATWDPEGILSTIPSIVNGIIGLLIGQVLQADTIKFKKRKEWVSLVRYLSFLA